MLTFHLWQSGNNSQWYFNITSGNNEKIAQSEGYVARQGAAHAIDLIRGSAGASAVMEYHNGGWTRLV